MHVQRIWISCGEHVCQHRAESALDVRARYLRRNIGQKRLYLLFRKQPV